MPLRTRIFKGVQAIMPPVLWAALRRTKDVSKSDYQGVQSIHDLSLLEAGAFGISFDNAATADTSASVEHVRLRVYNAAFLARLVSDVPGDFLFGGVSFGIAPRVLYDVAPRRHYHMVDPFIGVDSSGGTRSSYNTDPEAVIRQYPSDASITMHQVLIPDGLPLPGVKQLAFIHLNTGVPKAEAESFPQLYSMLSPGGIILIDAYAIAGMEGRRYFDPVLDAVGVVPFVMVTGQGVVMKPR